jgi:hypothetical protein
MTTSAGCCSFRPFRARGTFARMTRDLRVLRLAVALVPLLVVANGCFLFNHGTKDEQSTVVEGPEGEIALNVTNHNYLDVVVYVLHDGIQTRVGTVTGSSSTVFFLPTRLLGQGREIQLYGDAIGNDTYARTEIIVVQRGQYIEWTLETDLRRSSVGVF